MVRPAQFFGPLQGDQPTLPAPASRTLRVPAQLWALALASDLRSSLALHFLDHGRLFAADGSSASPYATNALLPMSDEFTYAEIGQGTTSVTGAMEMAFADSWAHFCVHHLNQDGLIRERSRLTAWLERMRPRSRQ